MKKELEITVKVNCSYEKLHADLIKQKFKIMEELGVMNDIYMFPFDANTDGIDELELLNKCVLIRHVANKKMALVYKFKKYAKNGDILEQGKVECPITDIDAAKTLLENINYGELFSIDDNCTIYSNGTCEICVQDVKDLGLFIEMEHDGRFIESNGNNVLEMMSNLNIIKMILPTLYICYNFINNNKGAYFEKY